MKSIDDTSFEQLQSKVIDFLRFPLIVWVVLIHSNISKIINVEANDFLIFSFVRYVFSNTFAHVAVPLFFFIAGFLLYHKMNSFTGKDYIKKLKSRFKTLVIPYILWNLIYIVIYAFIQFFVSSKRKLFQDYSFMDWTMLFWDTSYTNQVEVGGSGSGFPINVSLWFVRDLIILVLLSPIIFIFVKKLKQYFLFVLAVLWVSNLWFVTVSPTIVSFFFFSCGAFFSIHRMNFVKRIQPLWKISIIVYPILVLIEIWNFKSTPPPVWLSYMHNVGILFGMVISVLVSKRLILSGIQINKKLTESSFFVYAYHPIFLIIIVKLSFKILPHSDFFLCLAYFVCPLLIISFGVILNLFFKKKTPKLLSLFTGGR